MNKRDANRVVTAQLDAAARSPTAEIRPFHIDIPEKDLVDLRRRLVATRWPERQTVTDLSQGAKLAKIQSLLAYRATDYDWRKAEAKLNALPQFDRASSHGI